MLQQENRSAWPPGAASDLATAADVGLETEEDCPTAISGRGAELAAGAAVGVGATDSPERSAARAQAVAPVLGALLDITLKQLLEASHALCVAAYLTSRSAACRRGVTEQGAGGSAPCSQAICRQAEPHLCGWSFTGADQQRSHPYLERMPCLMT